MKVTILFFGIARDLTGVSTIAMELSEHSSVATFKIELISNYPELNHIESYAIAVNESYASDEVLLKENDVVAVIPPVSGG